MYGTASGTTAKAPGAKLRLTPARLAALVIGVPACLGVVGATGFSLVSDIGHGTIPVRYDIPAGAARVNLSLDGGNVVLGQVSSGQGSVVGTGAYSLFRPRVTERYSGGVASLRYSCRSPAGDCGLNAAVNVLPGQPVSVFTDGGTATARGTTGPVSLSTDGGDLTVNGAAGALTLDTGGGSINVTGAASPRVTADSNGGDIVITFTQVPANVRVSTGGGSITIIVPPGATQYDVTPSTGGGSEPTVGVPTSSTSPHKITATTDGGDITIRQAPS